MSPHTILNKYSPEPENLLMILHEIQNIDPRHYLSEESIRSVAEYLNLSIGEVTGVAEYYSMLSDRPRGRYVIRLCTSPVCRMLGSFDLLERIRVLLGIEVGETSEDGFFTLEKSECLGNCHKGPSMMVNDTLYGRLRPDKLEILLEGLKERARKESLHG